jgi:DNA processing protein
MPAAAGANDLAYWVALASIVRGRQLKRLIDRFASGSAAWQATRPELVAIGFEPATAERIAAERERLAPERALAEVERHGLSVARQSDPAYPPLLKETYDAPMLLFYRGRLPSAEDQTLAVVGTRSFSAYGKAATITLVRELAGAGLAIVSGLARGVDALAHETTLEVGGRTIAVLGSGLDDASVYPREHVRLAGRIVAGGGAVLSEYPPGVGPERHHFPERNRIIAGLSLGTLVVEAPETSGALITAKIALDYNREVLAVPGSIFERTAAGTNELLKLGARLVTAPADVLDALQLEARPTARHDARDLTDAERAILAALAGDPRHVDDLAAATALAAATLLSTLSLLELKGAVKDVGGKHYIRLA